MRELLVLCPRLPPFNAADAQRVRVLLPQLAAHGWRATVVALDPRGEDDAGDATLAATLPPEADILRVRAWPRRIAGRFGLRSHALRAWLPLRAALGRLLRTRRFDAGLVSNTDFALWPLSLRWPFPVVLDWQDPWWTTYYEEHPEVPRPGGRVRFGLMQALARRQEPRVARHAAAHLVVSDAYRRLLCDRYPDLGRARFELLPFAASARDLALARALPGPAPLPPGRARWWVAVGRGGEDLHFVLGALFEALAREREAAPARFADFGLLFVGTAYDPRVRATPLAALAARHGVGDLVVERPGRVGVLDALRLQDAAEAIVVAGSDDPGYMPSKLAGCLLSGRPLLGAFHAASAAHALAGAHAATRLLAFDPSREGAREGLVAAMRATWFGAPLPARASAVSLGALEAGAMSARLCALLDELVAARP
jgi:hypothetical protein